VKPSDVDRMAKEHVEGILADAASVGITSARVPPGIVVDGVSLGAFGQTVFRASRKDLEELLATLPTCEHGNRYGGKACGKLATQRSGDFGSHALLSSPWSHVCDEHGNPSDDGQSFQDLPWADLLRKSTT
jgi:hypothetical protein